MYRHEYSAKLFVCWKTKKQQKKHRGKRWEYKYIVIRRKSDNGVRVVLVRTTTNDTGRYRVLRHLIYSEPSNRHGLLYLTTWKEETCWPRRAGAPLPPSSPPPPHRAFTCAAAFLKINFIKIMVKIEPINTRIIVAVVSYDRPSSRTHTIGNNIILFIIIITIIIVVNSLFNDKSNANDVDRS